MKGQHLLRVKALVLPLVACLPFLAHVAKADFIFGEPEEVPNMTALYLLKNSVAIDR